MITFLTILIIYLVCDYMIGTLAYLGYRIDKPYNKRIKEEIIKHYLTCILPIKLIRMFIIKIKEIKEMYKDAKSNKPEKIILKEEAQMQAGNLSISENNNDGGLSIL